MTDATLGLRGDEVVVDFGKGSSRIRAVAGVSVVVAPGHVVGIVGESGSGKSTLGRVLTGLQRPDFGEVYVDAERVVGSGSRFPRIMRSRVQMVFQDPYSSLNPSQRAWRAVGEALRVWTDVDRAEARSRALAILTSVGIGTAEADRYPSELSGGQRQRVSMARALAVNPDYLVADEPTSALDQSTQAHLLQLLREIQEERKLGLMLITHDLKIVRFLADHTYVMKSGVVVEEGATEQIFTDPSSNYTRSLIEAIDP